MEDSLIITYDNCPPDAPTLIVARKDKYDMTMLKIVHGDEAFGIYHYLIDNAFLSEQEIVRCRNCNVPHNKWTGCPKLNGLVTSPDFYCAFGERKN